MPKTVIPAGYRPALGLYDTQKAIGLIKQIFLEKLCGALHLKRVTAPLFVDPATGLNDDLNGVERPVTLRRARAGGNAEVVHSLAKWKRMALAQYDFQPGNGLYHGHERHPPGRGDGQPSLHLCGPVGLGKGHHPGGAQPRTI